MSIITDDSSVAGTTDWIKIEDGQAPFSVQVHVIVPGATTIDYSLQGIVQRDSPNDSAPAAEDIITYIPMENETATKIANIVSPVPWLRILVNSISGGDYRLKIDQAGRIQFSENEVG